MKKLFLPVLILAFFTSCKKNNQVKPVDHLTDLQTKIAGNWYYNSLSLGFYSNPTTDVYDEVVTATDLRNEPYFVFNKNFSGSYIDPTNTNPPASFTYLITSANGADSLFCRGGVNLKMGIRFISGSQIQIHESIPDTTQVLNVSGRVVTTYTTQLSATLVNAPLK